MADIRCFRNLATLPRQKDASSDEQLQVVDRIVKAAADPGRVTPGYLCGGLTIPNGKKPVVHRMVLSLLPFSETGDRGFNS